MAMTISRVWLLTVWLLVAAMAHSAEAQSFGGNVRGMVHGVVNAWNGAVEKVKNSIENRFDWDMNKDGQIGKFRSVPDDEANTREVTTDKNAAGRFSQSRPRTGRALRQTEEVVAERAPVSYGFGSKFSTKKVSVDGNGADRFKQSRPRTG